MPRRDPEIVPILFQRLGDNAEGIAWQLQLSGVFEVTQPLQAMLMEAGATGKSLIVGAYLVPTEDFFPEEEDPPTQEESRD